MTRLLGDFPGGPVMGLHLPMPGLQVQSLVGQLGSHMPHSQKTKEKNPKKT